NGNETFSVTLSDPTGGASVDSPGTASVTINDPLSFEPLPGNLPSLANALTHADESYVYFIRRAYELYLHRDPEQDGVHFWLALMRSGFRDESLEAGFLGSPEYIANHGGTGGGWVKGMYEDLLGREPEQDGYNFWVNALAHGANPAEVALGFAASEER